MIDFFSLFPLNNKIINIIININTNYLISLNPIQFETKFVRIKE